MKPSVSTPAPGLDAAPAELGCQGHELNAQQGFAEGP
jgi:hypothetical protein